MAKPTQREPGGLFGSAAVWFFCAFAVIALFFLVAEHRAHLGFLIPYVPLAFLGLCVVLHSYMHGFAHGPRPGGDASPDADADTTRRDHDHTHS